MPTRKWKTETLVSNLPGGNDAPQVLKLNDGTYAIAWTEYLNNTNNTKLHWQRFDAAGTEIGAEVILPTSNAPGENYLAKFSVLSDGNIFVSYYDGLGTFDPDVRGDVFTPAGTLVRTQHANTSTDWHRTESFESSVSLGSNGSVVVYEHRTMLGMSIVDINVVMKGFDTNGNVTFAEQVVNTDVATLLQYQTKPIVSATKDGSTFMVQWTDAAFPNDVRARIFNGSGVELVSDFTLGNFSGASPAISWLSNSIFVAAWESPTGDFSGSCIKYKLFNSSGLAITGSDLANTTTTGLQSIPIIANLANGGFVIGWSDQSQTGGDTSGYAIRLQVFDAVGAKVGQELLVNSTTTGNQFLRSLETLDDGRVVATWVDYSGTAMIRSQIIDPRDGIVEGTPQSEILYGHDAVADVITGYAGADTIHGLNGGDVIDGGDGDDVIYAGKGDDIVYAGNDNDTIYGDAGDDDLYGEAGIDKFYTSAGSDLYDGGSGTDVLYFTGATTGVVVNMTDDTLNAGAALGDTVVGIENVFGTNHADTIVGNNGKNIFYATGGNDILQGGQNADTLYGGTGSDSFVFAQGDSGLLSTTLDRIGDYAKGAVGTGDEIDYSSILKIGGSNVLATPNEASINATNGVVTFDAGSGTTLADALNDISFRMTVAANSVGEFAFFQLSGAGDHYMFISDGVAGLGANDVLIRMTGVTAINTISIDAGDVTILT